MQMVTLFQRVVVVNALVLAGAALILALSPATVSERIKLNEALILLLGGAAVLAVNLLLVRRVFDPLGRLTRQARAIDPMHPGRRITVERPTAEVAALCDAVNAMLDRLERERRDSGRRALLGAGGRAAPDRARAARRGGQTRTAAAAEATAAAGVEQVRQIAPGLRPEALDDFGLRSALVTLASFGERTGLRIETRLEEQAHGLGEARELVVYRVA